MWTGIILLGPPRMPNADTTLIDGTEEAGVSLAPYTGMRDPLSRGVRSAEAEHHIPGDTLAPSTPGAVWIGTGDA